MANRRRATTAPIAAGDAPADVELGMNAPVENAEKPVRAKQPKEFKANDLIPCKSITAGRMIYLGQRTGTPYVWVNAGDTAYIEYQDLMAAILSHSDYVYSPNFVIEDDDILNDRRWSELKELYDRLYDSGDVKKLLNLPTGQFKTELKKAPKGLQDAVKAEMVEGIKNGTFDSINKVKAADEILNTKMADML